MLLFVSETVAMGLYAICILQIHSFPHAPCFYIPCALNATHPLYLYVLRCTYIPCPVLLYMPKFQCIPMFPYHLCPYVPLFATVLSLPCIGPLFLSLPPMFPRPYCPLCSRSILSMSSPGTYASCNFTFLHLTCMLTYPLTMPHTLLGCSSLSLSLKLCVK